MRLLKLIHLADMLGRVGELERMPLQCRQGNAGP